MGEAASKAGRSHLGYKVGLLTPRHVGRWGKWGKAERNLGQVAGARGWGVTRQPGLSSAGAACLCDSSSEPHGAPPGASLKGRRTRESQERLAVRLIRSGQDPCQCRAAGAELRLVETHLTPISSSFLTEGYMEG